MIDEVIRYQLAPPKTALFIERKVHEMLFERFQLQLLSWEAVSVMLESYLCDLPSALVAQKYEHVLPEIDARNCLIVVEERFDCSEQLLRQLVRLVKDEHGPLASLCSRHDSVAQLTPILAYLRFVREVVRCYDMLHEATVQSESELE